MPSLNNRIAQAVIFAGGLGTRLRPFTDTKPKCLFPIDKKPFLVYLLQQLTYYLGIERITLLLGYHAEDVITYCKKKKLDKKYNLKFYTTPDDYTTGDRLLNARHGLYNTFLAIYCDNLCYMKIQDIRNNWFSMRKEQDILGQITCYSNKNNYTKNNVYVENNVVIDYDPTRQKSNLNVVNIGYMILDKKILSYIEPHTQIEAIFPKLISEKRLGAYITDQPYASIGSTERIKDANAFITNKAVFLDRDGVINKKAPKGKYITTWESFEWLEGVKQAIKILKTAGFYVIVVTNQPLARAGVTKEQVEELHEKMRQELRKYGTDVDSIECCYHDWDENCDCRKPKPGMLLHAMQEHKLLPTRCIMIGDSDTDKNAASAAGCYFMRVYSPETNVYNKFQFEHNNLLSCVHHIINYRLPNVL